jgi:hypothetical protein
MAFVTLIAISCSLLMAAGMACTVESTGPARLHMQVISKS